MKVITGTLSGNQITLDEQPRWRGKTRVQLVMQVVEPLPEDDAPIPQSQEEIDIVVKGRRRRAELTRKEAG